MSAGVEKNYLPAAREQNCSCRICLMKIESNSKMVMLLEAWPNPWEGMKATVAEDLYSLTNIQVTNYDSFSKGICESCCDKLRIACEIIRIAQCNNIVLTQRSPQKDTVWPKPIQLDKNVSERLFENVMEVEVKQEVLSDNEEMSTANVNYDYYNSDEIKIEPEEISTQDVSNAISLEACSIPLSNYEQLNGNTNGHCFDEEYLDQIKEEPVDSDDELSAFDLPLDCLLCSKNFNSMTGLKAHVIAQHSYKSVKRRAIGSVSPAKKIKKNISYVCTTCKRSFTTSTDLMVHETRHSNMACYMCNRKFDTFELLSRHRKRCRAVKDTAKVKTLNDVKRPASEVMQCPTCSEKLSNPYYLKIHTEIHHSSPSANVVKEERIPEIKEEIISLDKLNKDLEGTNEKSNENFEAVPNGGSTINVNIGFEKVDSETMNSEKCVKLVDSVEENLESIFGLKTELKTEVNL